MDGKNKGYFRTNDIISNLLDRGKEASNNSSTKSEPVGEPDWEQVELPKESKLPEEGFYFVRTTEATKLSYAEVARYGSNIGEENKDGFVSLTQLNAGQGRGGKS